MLIAETIAKIRRAHFLQGKGIKTICREFGLSRKVVRKVLRSGATEFRYEPLPKLGLPKCARGRCRFYPCRTIVRVTAGYPYFLQEWDHGVWQHATTSQIAENVVL